MGVKWPFGSLVLSLEVSASSLRGESFGILPCKLQLVSMHNKHHQHTSARILVCYVSLFVRYCVQYRYISVEFGSSCHHCAGESFPASYNWFQCIAGIIRTVSTPLRWLIWFLVCLGQCRYPCNVSKCRGVEFRSSKISTTIPATTILPQICVSQRSRRAEFAATALAQTQYFVAIRLVDFVGIIRLVFYFLCPTQPPLSPPTRRQKYR